MKIVSENQEFLKAFEKQLKSQGIKTKAETKSVEEGGKGGEILLYIAIAQLGLQAISTFIDTLTYVEERKQSQKAENSYKLHYIIDTRSGEKEFIEENLSLEERNSKLAKLLKSHFDEIKYLYKG